jgi:hypothetical protein
VILSNVPCDAIQSNSQINSSTRYFLSISDLELRCVAENNGGAGIADVAGSYISIHRVVIDGFRYGIIFDQTEISDIDLCDFEGQGFAGVWLVNGPDHTPGSDGSFTNRITIRRCQFNGSAETVGIIDDGGTCHSFVDNNYNACHHHIYLAGATAVTIASSQFESAADAPILTGINRYESQEVAGPVVLVTIRDNVIVSKAGMPCVRFGSSSPVMLLNNLVSSTCSAFKGIATCYSVTALTNYNNLNPDPRTNLFDGSPTRLFAFINVPGSEDNSLETTRLTIGDGTPITRHLSGSTKWDPAVPSNEATSTEFVVRGARVGDTVAVGFSRPVPGGALLVGAVTDTDTVTVTLLNQTGGELSPGDGVLRADVWQH